jgi:CheY-like chemotaxis protein
MASAEAAPPRKREGRTQRDEQDGMRDVLGRCGHAYVEKAALAAERVAQDYHSALGLYDELVLARAAPLAPACFVVRTGCSHVKTGHCAARRALLLALRDAPADVCTWVHLHVGHPSVLPAVRGPGGHRTSFAHQFVDPFRDWRAAVVFLASLQDDALAALLALLCWLKPVSADQAVIEPVAQTRAKFRRHVGEARAAAAASSADGAENFDLALLDVSDPDVDAGFEAAPALRARFLAPMPGGAARSLADAEAHLRGLPRRESSALTVPLQLPSFPGVLRKRARAAAVSHAATARGVARASKRRPGGVAAALSKRIAVPVEKAAEEVQWKRMDCFTKWRGVRWGTNTYVNFLYGLMSAGLLPPTADGRPTGELGLAYLAAVCPLADGEDEDGQPVEGGEGYNIQTSVPALITALMSYCSLRGWGVDSETRAAWRGAVTAIRKVDHDDVVTRSPPAFERHVKEAAELLDVGPEGWHARGDLAETPRLDLLQLEVLVTSNAIHGRRQTSVSELTSGDVAYNKLDSLDRPFIDISWQRDGKCNSQMDAVGAISDENLVLKCIQMERAMGNFEHSDSLEDVLVCGAKRPAALSSPLFRALLPDGTPTHEPYGARRGGQGASVVMGMAGRNVTGHGHRSGVMVGQYCRDVIRYGTKAEACTSLARILCGWVDANGRNQAPVKAYARKMHAQLAIIASQWPDDTPAHVEKRRRLVLDLQDAETPRRGGFVLGAAQRGAAGVAAELKRRYNVRARLLLCDDDALPARVVPLLMSDDVLRLQAQLRMLVRKHELPSLRAPSAYAALRALRASSDDAADELQRVRAELSEALKFERERAPATASGAADAMQMRFARAPCRHLNLKALRESTRYRFTHEQLAMMPAEQMKALLQDPDVSYECPLAKRA